MERIECADLLHEKRKQVEFLDSTVQVQSAGLANLDSKISIQEREISVVRSQRDDKATKLAKAEKRITELEEDVKRLKKGRNRYAILFYGHLAVDAVYLWLISK